MNQAPSVSQTASTSSHSTQVLDAQSKAGSIAKFYPLFSAVFQNAKIPVAISQPFLMIFFFQVLYISLWPWSDYWTEYNDNYTMKLLKSIFFFIPQPAKPLYYIILSAIVFVINAIFGTLVTFQLIYYRINRKFIDFLNYPIRFFIDTILVATITPCLVNSGETFVLVARGSTDPMVIISMILFMTTVAYEAIAFIMVQKLSAKSIFINPSPMLNFDPTIMVSTLSSMLITIGLFFIFTLFEAWSEIFPIVLHISIYIYEEYYMVKNVPFVDNMTNSLSFGWFLGCIIGDIFMIVTYFHHDINYKIPLIGILVCFISFVMVGTVVFTIRIKKIVTILSKENNTMEEAFDYYKEIQLDTNPSNALLYLKIAFQNYCPCFYDWSLVNFIADNFQEEQLLSTTLQLSSFFPNETRLQNRLQAILLKQRTVKFDTGFLLFQVDAIKAIRQFSASNSLKLKLIDLKNQSNGAEMMTKSAIDAKDLNPEFFEQLAHRTSTTRVIWVESLNSQPNNPKYYEEFSKYLIEAESDFKGGLQIKNKQNMLEAGANFAIDYSFRSMVEGFPKYLVDKIIDTRGKIIAKRKVPDMSKTSSSSNSSTDNSNFTTEIDESVIEYIGKQTIKMSRARLALDSMLETKKPKSIQAIIPTTIIIVLYCLAMFIAFFTMSSFDLKNYHKTIEPLQYFSQARFYLAVSNIDIIIEYMADNGKFQKYNDLIFEMFQSDDHYYIDMLTNMLPEVTANTENGSQNYEKLIAYVVEAARSSDSVDNIIGALTDNSLTWVTCGPTGIPFGQSKSTIQSVMSAVFTNQRFISGFSSVQNAMSDPNTCEDTLNFLQLYAGSTYVFDNISEFQMLKGKKIDRKLNILSIVLPIVTFVVIFIPIIILNICIKRVFKHIIEIISSMDQADKNEAKENIIMNGSSTDIIVDNKNHKSTSAIILVVIGLMSLFCLVMCLISGLYIKKINTDLNNLNSWFMFSTLRSSLLAESMNLLMSCLAVFEIPQQSSLISTTLAVTITKQITDKLVETDTNLLNGTANTKACFGFDSTLDDINAINSPIYTNTTNPEEYFSNASVHSMINIYSSYVNSIVDIILKNGTLSSQTVATTIYLVNDRLFYKIQQASDRISELSSNEIKKLEKFYTIIFVCIIICVGIYICFVIMFYKNRMGVYRASLFIVKRFSPFTLVNNKMFNKMFLKSEDSNRNKKMTIENIIIQNSQDSIFCTSSGGVVEIVNNSVSTLLGYKPEQLLGQKVEEFLLQKDAETFSQKMDMMRDGQISQYYEDNFTAVSDTTEEIPVHVTIIGMKKENDTKINSFVVILRDQTMLIKQKKQAEEAKAKSERLLYQILPRDIVVQLNRGEKDISFVVPSATVVFIDINKFSEYTANLSPQDIMSNLSYYFAMVDKVAAKYKMITKIKLIGDIYMAATGLFNPEVQPISHAEQTIDFALDCINELDEVNVKLEANLQIRIGVNTGGPLIAGVLGTDKPVFDIIGDAINVAARLQTTSDVNHVHISQATYDLVKESNYEFQKRGETFLKGKGKQITYYASRMQTSFIQDSLN